jgi:hypothetical protein
LRLVYAVALMIAAGLGSRVFGTFLRRGVRRRR